MLVFPFNIDITAVHWGRDETYHSLASKDGFDTKVDPYTYYLTFASIHLYKHFFLTRSYAALRAADLDWIVGPGYSLGRVYPGEKPWKTNRGGGQGRNKQKRYKFRH